MAFLPPDTDLHRIRAALAQGVPIRVRHQDRDLPLYYVQLEGTPTLHCTTMHEYTGVDYAISVPLDGAVWAQLMAQLPG